MACRIRTRMKTKLIFSIIIIGAIILASAVSAAGLNSTVCCEKTKADSKNGVLYCQNVPANECEPGARQVPTSCESTSYCKLGTCYNSIEGNCLDNTPQSVCTANKGIWSEETPPQCSLGCCVLGDQAAFVSLVRCKRLSAFLGLQTNYKPNIQDEVQCVLSVQNQEKGACVYEFEFEKTCKVTSRAECSGGVNGTKAEGQFYPGKLCSAEELGTPCAPTRETMCLPGKDEVYFVDSCGNTANIYDASKIDDKRYWSTIFDKSEACNPNSPKANNAVGSRFYKHICINGEEVLEQCADFRQEECIEDSIESTAGPFSQAACRVNRWQDCTAQREQIDCENTDRRDCIWKSGIRLGNATGGVCVPKNTPGLKFWEGEESKAICAQGSSSCVVTFEKGLIGGEKCIGNCECLTEEWKKQRADLCLALETADLK